MTIGELIEELRKYDPAGTVELQDAGGAMGSSQTGWMPDDADLEEVRETKTGVILSSF